MTTTRTPPLDAAILERLLRSYKPMCRYVLEAKLEHPADQRPPHPDDPSSWIGAQGRCGIPSSCYCDDPGGHFTAVEFNITYNQLCYACLAGAVQHELIAELRHWSMEEWWRRHLPDVLIVDYHARFHQPMLAQAFSGRVEIRQVLPKPHKRLVLLQTVCQMQDDSGGHADADVLLALVRM